MGIKGKSNHNAFTTHCKRGHRFSFRNTIIQIIKGRNPKRICKKCKAIWAKKWYDNNYRKQVDFDRIVNRKANLEVFL